MSEPTAPLSDDQHAAALVAAIRAAYESGTTVLHSRTEIGVLLAEVDRLKAESEQRLGELLFWHFEYREAMDNFRGENWQVGQLRTALATAESLAAEYGARIVAASMAAAPRETPEG